MEGGSKILQLFSHMTFNLDKFEKLHPAISEDAFLQYLSR